MANNFENIKKLFFKLTDKKVKTITKYDDGFSNQVYLINDAYVLKTPKEFIAPFIDYKNEKYILEVLKDNKNVVNTYLYDINSKTLIMKVVHQARLYNQLEKNQIILLAKALKKLHKIEDFNIEPFKMVDRLKLYKTYSKEPIDGRYERKIINRINKGIKKERLCLCHNDLVRNNLLFKYNNVVLIDFEFAGLNYLYFDLASFISENNLNDEQKNIFLKAYFGYRLNKNKIKKVDNFIQFEDILWYYWAEMMYENSKDECFINIKKEKLNRISQNIKNNN